MVGKAAYGFDAGLTSHGRSRPISFAIVRFALVLVLFISVLISISSALLLLYGWTHNETVFQGVTFAGVDLGGLNQQQVTERINTRLDTVSPKEVVLSYEGRSWPIPVSSLGISYDVNATAERALQVGHSGNLWIQSHDWLTTLSSGERVPITFSLNDQSAYSVLQGLASGVTRSPQDAQYIFASDGSLDIQPGKAGVAIDVSATLQSIRNSVAHLSSAPIEIRTQSIRPMIDAKALQPGLDQANQMVSSPFVLTFNGTKWAVPPETLREMLVLDPSTSGKDRVGISSSVLESYIAQIADQVHTNGQNAGVTWDNNQFVIVKSTDGEKLDPMATTSSMIQALKNGNHQTAVAVTSVPAAVSDADARDAIARAGQLITQPLSLKWSGGGQDLDKAQMASILSFTAQSDQSPKIAIGINNDAIISLLESIRSQVEVAPKDANLRYLNGQVTVVSPEQVGSSLNVDASAKAIETALASGDNSVSLSTTPVEPTVTAAMASSISVPDILSSAKTYYGGSVANRAFNVDLAIERVNGALIPPGGTFSFDGTVGAVDTAHGYKVGYGIVATSNGSVSTVPSVGGGICQVATTLFHTAFWSGMPIVQRSWHLYWIPLYGQAPDGITGLDATVDTDVGLDLKFKNTTDHWLAVVASSDGTWVRFELRGTDPGWTVNVDDPVVTNVVKADTTMQIEKSDQLPAGTSVLVEHAEDGFDVVVHRQVVKDGKVVDDLTMKSHYLPSANVTLQGTGT